jgi:phosphoglycolate phosphatase
MNRRGVAAVVFDLDGTLVDSLPGIEASIRRAAELCLPGRVLPALRDFVGPPIGKMLARLWPDIPEKKMREVLAAFRRHYDADGCRQTRLFDGVNGTLTRLAESGIEMFVLTNKPLQPTLTILDLAGIRRRFRAVVSPDSSDPPFAAKSDGASHLHREHALDASRTLLVGDGIDDAEAAAKCGFGFVAAAYGYGDAAKRDDLAPVAVLKTFSEIERIVL